MCSFFVTTVIMLIIIYWTWFDAVGWATGRASGL